MEANYFIEVCKKILNELRFSDEELTSSCLFCSTATHFLEHEASSTFSNKLVCLLKDAFTTYLNLSRLWPAFHKFATGDIVKLEVL